MPRLRLRRLLLSLVAFVCLAFLVINFRFRDAILSGSSRVNGDDSEPTVSSTNTGGQDDPNKKSLDSFKDSRDIHLDPDNTGNGIRDTSFDFRLNRPWFMHGGKSRPSPEGPRTRLWPEEDRFGDKIVNQLMYVPPGPAIERSFGGRRNVAHREEDVPEEEDGGVGGDTSPKALKKILLFFGRGGWNDLPMGRDVFLRDKCPVDTCELTTDTRDAEQADAIFFKDRFSWPKHRRHPKQVWILFLLECPLHTQGFGGLGDIFNWTATYRHDSDLVAPYEKWVPYDHHLKTKASTKNFAKGKSKMVAWFVSNCAARNKRMQYARELARHIGVDIYGSCGPKRCPRNQASRCFEMLDKDYRFYLAFENSNCKDYITEKFFVNGLSRDVIPIVMGARPEDYERSAPYKSYIHVEQFPSAKELAGYLRVLASNETMYNEYFRWKGTGEFVNTFFWCRLCALLHAQPHHSKAYKDIHNWWAGKGTCVPDTWNPVVRATTTTTTIKNMVETNPPVGVKNGG